MQRLALLCLAFSMVRIAWGDSEPAESPAVDERRPDPAEIEFFEQKVRPILAENCFKCHGPLKQKGGLRLDSREMLLKGGETGAAVVPGKPDESELVEAVNYDADGFQMPPTGKLSEETIATLTEWVRRGAPWPDSKPAGAATEEGGIDLVERAKHWSFQPVRAVAAPRVPNADWTQTPIDNFILAQLDEAGLSPAEPADRRTLLRRVTYDLTGLPPTPDEIGAFVSDTAPDAYEQVVDRLLASPRYGERWGRHWLDLVRFAETLGHEFDFEIERAWMYRDYVIRALNADVQFDQFVTEHIAGDLLKSPRRDPATGNIESIIGTGFYWFGQGKHSPVDIRADECDRVDNQLDVLGKTFLGLTIACARCHNHKFDPITARDYYAMAGFLQSARQQYAAVDPPESQQQHIDELRQLQTEHLNALTAATADQLRSAADAADTSLDPLKLWEILPREIAAPEFAGRRDQLLRDLTKQSADAEAALAATELFEDFDDGTFDDWFVSGEAFELHPTLKPVALVGSSAAKPIHGIAAAGLAHSGLVSRRLHGVLRSETFAVTKRYIYYRMLRRGGRENPGRLNKNGQVHFIVDEFHIIRNPLYGRLTLNIPSTDEFAWYGQDLGGMIGSRGYIEIEDSDDGEIVIDRIVFSNSPNPPADPPNPLVAQLLADQPSADALSSAYAELVRQTIDAWMSGSLATDPDCDARVALLKQLIANSSIPSPPRGEGRGEGQSADGSGGAPILSVSLDESHAQVAAILHDYASVESRIELPTTVIATADGTPENEHLLIRGNHKKPGDEVQRRFLEVLGGLDHPAPADASGRLELARQIVSSENPLTARVIVNRLWHHHFGRGLVPTPDDFGHMGQPPSHPELLDWLAAELMRHKWSLKAVHRQIVLSATYRMSSQSTDLRAETLDPENKLLHRMNVRRMEGEAIRDGLLAISGRLEERLYGPGVLPYLTEFMEGRGRPKESGPLDGAGRRSVYISVRRNFLTPMFLAFDFPTPFTTAGRRSVSNVPAQALTMMNNPFVVEQARVWAERALVDADVSREQRVERLYVTAFGRPPTDDELAASLRFLNEQTNNDDGGQDGGEVRLWTDLCHALLNVKEFVFVN